jgi:hypothetical protein
MRCSKSKFWPAGSPYWLGPAACVLAVAFGTGSAHADPIVQTQTLADAPSDFSSGVTFNKFDPTLGTLTGVGVNLTGNVTGSVAYESREAAPSTLSASLDGSVAVGRPDNSPIIAVAPSASTFANLAAFDGTTDFAGPSGGSVVLSSNASAMTSGTLSTADKALFTGPGTITLPVTAQVRANETGPANLAARFQAQAGASVALTYNFSAPGETGGGSSGGSDFTTMTSSGLGLLTVGSVTSAPQTQKIADQTTGWKNGIAFQKFNPALGTLEDVNLTLVSDVKARQSFENLGATPTTITGSQLAFLTLALKGNNLLTVGTALNKFASLAGFDGTVDFAGTSGITFADLLGSDTSVTSLFDGLDLSLFTGPGSLSLDLSATGTSSVNGPGNMLLDLSEEAGANVDLTYTYLPGSDAAFAVPEPASWAILAGPLVFWAFIARRRRIIARPIR